MFARGTVREDGVDLREDFTLGYADARFAHGASSMVEWIDPSAAISGTDAYVTIAGGFWYASQLTIHHPLPWGQRRQEVVEVEREGNGYVPMLPRRHRRDPGGRSRAPRAHGGRDRRDLRGLRRDHGARSRV